MPKRTVTETPDGDGTVDHDALHPVGVAGDPEATNPHEADPTPNVESEKNKRERVNAGIVTNAFEVVGERPADARTRTAPQGRQLNDQTVAALQFLRANKGQYCKVGEWTKPNAPSARLSWAGYTVSDEGELIAPNAEQEKRNAPSDYEVKKKIAYTYRKNAKGTLDLLLCLTDEDWTEPKKRGPRTPKDSVNTTTTDTADGDTDNPNEDGDDTPVDQETEPTEAQG